MDLSNLSALMRRAGSQADKYLSGVETAVKPGASNDLFSFIQNELTKYPGTRDADPNAGGFDVANNILRNLLSITGMNDPITQAGGPSSAVLGPIRSAAQKHAIKALFRHDPKTLEAVVSDPRIMQVSTPTIEGTKILSQSGALPSNALATYTGSSSLPTGTIRVPATTMRGKNPQGVMNPLANVPQVVGHEATHFLNEPRIYNKLYASEVPTMFKQLAPFLTPHAKNAARTGAEASSNIGVALDEALAYLTGKGTRAPQNELIGSELSNLLRGGPKAISLNPENIRNAIAQATNTAYTNNTQEVEQLIQQLMGGK